MSLPKAVSSNSSKSRWRLAGIFLLIVVVVGVCFSWQHFKTRQLTTAETKMVIREYLEAKAGVRKFEPIVLESFATNQTNADSSQGADEEANPKKSEKKKKKKNHSLPERATRDFRRSLKDSQDYQTTYRLIGENLARADELLASSDSDEVEAGLALAVAATRAALEPAVDGWLAARIVEGYVWPNLGKAPASDKGSIDATSLLDVAEDAFQAADEVDNLVRTYRQYIARNDPTGKTDKYRVRLAKVLESEQKFKEALRVLHQVQDTNNPSLARHISSVEIMLQQASASR